MIASTATCPAGCDQAGCMQNKSGNDLKIISPEMIASTATCPAGCDQAGCMQNKSGNDLKIISPAAYTT
jgi:uncharacterized cupin superfamily protein